MHVEQCRVTRTDFHIHHADLLVCQHKPVTRLFVHRNRRLSRYPRRNRQQEQESGPNHDVIKLERTASDHRRLSSHIDFVIPPVLFSGS